MKKILLILLLAISSVSYGQNTLYGRATALETRATALEAKNALIKTYRGTLTQTSTGAPTIGNAITDFGATTFTWARTSAGVYTCSASAASFTANKTFITFSAPPYTLVSYFAVITSSTVVTITTGLLTAGVAIPTDGLLTNTNIIVSVYQ